MTAFRLTRSARADLDQIWDYIAHDNPSAARAMIARIIAALDNLVLFPQMGPAREELSPGLRSFPVKPYLILYRPLAEGIEVLRVVHGARNLENLEGF